MPKLAQPEATGILPLDCNRVEFVWPPRTGMKNLAKSDGQQWIALTPYDC
jgi:hypothetical protein